MRCSPKAWGCSLWCGPRVPSLVLRWLRALAAGVGCGRWLRALAAGADGSATGAAAGEAQESLDTARATEVAVAADLPPPLREAWLCRPDIEALFA